MALLLPVFKGVSVIFALLSVGTGARALLDPQGFSESFGLPIDRPNLQIAATAASTPHLTQHARSTAITYASLTGVRQLATGLVLLVFVNKGKWQEIATFLAIIGIVVAGTDGLYLYRAGYPGAAGFHALPGAMISALACGVIWLER